MLTTIILPILAGVCIFMIGMKTMELALQQWAGPSLSRVLQTFTKTPVYGLITGMVMTALLQSSGAVTVLTISMVNAGVMSFGSTLGIILGTNIGTCLTTELLGLNISSYGVPLLLVSSAVWMASWLAGPVPRTTEAPGGNRKPALAWPDSGLQVPRQADHSGSRSWIRSVRFGSLAAAGFAMVLMGIRIMQNVGPALQNQGMFTWFMEHAEQSLIWGVMAGTVITALIHSSTAVIALAMGLAATSTVSPELGMAVMLGANIGTCSTAWLASLGGTRAGSFVAWAHITLNLGGALLFYPFLRELYQFISWMTDDPSAQLARSQTVFNIVCSVLALPLCYSKRLKTLGGPDSHK